MDALIGRFRNLMVLTIVVAFQLILLAYQVKTNQDIRLVRVWAVTAITPAARVIESVRSGATGFFSDYFFLLDVRDENQRMKSELGRLKLENQFLKTELSTADRARALAAFQSRSPSRTIPARIIGNGTGANSKVVFIDRGSGSGVEKGMAVITPDGIVGKVIQAFPVASQVLLVTDPTFAAGVVSQKNFVRGTVKGQGGPTCMVDYVQNEEKVEKGEWFYTSGDDRVFPKGVPVGQATVVRDGKQEKVIYLAPSGLQGGFDEVLVVLEAVHQPIPEASQASASMHMLPPPPSDATPGAASPSALSTDADKLLEKYKRLGEAQGHVFGDRNSQAPNFNIEADKAQRPRESGGAPSGAGSPGAGVAGAQTQTQAQTQPAAPAAPAPAKPAAGTPDGRPASRPAEGSPVLPAPPR